VRSLKRVPWSVYAYLAIVLASMALLPGEDDPRAFDGALLLLTASAGLLMRLWIAWAFLVVIHLGNLALVATQWPAWALHILLLNGVMAALLLATPTRHYPRWPRFTQRFAR
jgi:hypothetical protein